MEVLQNPLLGIAKPLKTHDAHKNKMLLARK